MHDLINKRFYEHIDGLAKFKSILCLNGDLPSQSFFESLLPVIAVDGATNHLLQQKITPHIILGDLDSVAPSIYTQFNHLYLPDQNYCDYQKSMHYLQHNDLLPTIVVGIDGGYIDHVLNNINLFLDSQSIFYAPPIVGHLLRGASTTIFNLSQGTKISLMAIPFASVTTSGLYWNLDRRALSFPGANSCFNRVNEKKIMIQVEEGALLVMIYLQDIKDAAWS